MHSKLGTSLLVFAMTNYSRSLHQLCACFRGHLPNHPDWMSLLGLANQTLTTPALMKFATGFKDQIPKDVYLYIQEMFERNVARNDRLAEQLAETVAAINDRGVMPILLKGSAMLASTARSHWGSKLMCDLDIMVFPDQVEAALSGLAAVGYRVHTYPLVSGKWYVDLKRSSDVGMIDLHRELPGHRRLYSPSNGVIAHCKLMQVGQGRAYVPSPTYQALILTMHDQFQDYDYWTGNMDVRHLIELRDLAASPEGIDWEALAALTPGKLARNALETQLVALFRLLNVDVPVRSRNRFIPRLQHRRRLAQAMFPLLRQALLPIGLLDYPNYRDELGTPDNEQYIAGSARLLPKVDTLRFLLSLARQRRVSKI
jgi:Uncharacterised nucleotidyltransferase